MEKTSRKEREKTETEIKENTETIDTIDSHKQTYIIVIHTDKIILSILFIASLIFTWMFFILLNNNC